MATRGQILDHMGRPTWKKHRQIDPMDLSVKPAVWYREIFDATNGVWTDKTGNGRHSTPQSATRPTAAAGINGKLTVQFAGAANQALVIPATTFGPFSLAMVVRLTGAAPYLAIVNADGGANPGILYGSTGNTIHVGRATVVTSKNRASNWAVDNVAKAILWTFDGTAAGHRLYINGVDQSMTTVTGNNPGTATLSQSVFIGAGQNGLIPATGHYGDVALWHSALAAGDVLNYFRYTRGFWGV